MNAIEEWLKANAEFCATNDEYRIDKGGCTTIFKITEFDTISMEWFDENEESFCHLTTDEFIKGYML